MGACDLPLMQTVCNTIGGSVSGTITDGIGAWIVKSIGELAQSATDLAASAVDRTTAVDLDATWFRSNYELLLPIGLVLTVGTFCLQLMRAAWRRDERALAQAVSGTVGGVLFAFAAVACTTVALTVVDALSAGLFKAAHSSVDNAIHRIIELNNLGPMYALGWTIPAVMGLGSALGAFLYWAVMVARKVGILVLVTLAVFAGAGGGWEVARRWRRGWIEATATLIVSKLLMTIVFLLGVSAMGKSDASDGLGALSDSLAGIVIMIMVMLCPYATYKFVHWAADGGGHGDLHRTGVAGAAVIGGAAKTAGQLAVQASIGMRAPQGPAKIPGQGSGGVASGIDPVGGAVGGAVADGRTQRAHSRGDADLRTDRSRGGRAPAQPPSTGGGGQPPTPPPASTAGTGTAPATPGPAPHGSSAAEPRVTHLDPPAPRRRE